MVGKFKKGDRVIGKWRNDPVVVEGVVSDIDDDRLIVRITRVINKPTDCYTNCQINYPWVIDPSLTSHVKNHNIINIINNL